MRKYRRDGQQLKSGIHGSQELMSFDGPLRINTGDYDIVQAREAARHRQERVGAYALTPITQGFRQRTQNLWVPHSGMENTAAVNNPEIQYMKNRQAAHDRVMEKYEGSDKDPQRVEQWANFSGNKAAIDTLKKYAGSKLDAAERHRAMHVGFGPGEATAEEYDLSISHAKEYIADAEKRYKRINEGVSKEGIIERDRIEANEVALNGVAHYVTMLGAFVGQPEMLNVHERRKWPQERHVHKYAEHQARAKEWMDTLPTWDFELLVKEAYFSERSREEYWKQARELHNRLVLEGGIRWTLTQPNPPIDIYDADPRVNPNNYVNGFYIG